MSVLQGVLGLKKSYFEPRYILLLPTQVEKYTGLLQSRGLYTPAQIDAAVSRVELYADANKQRPGFFDSVIPCSTATKVKARAIQCRVTTCGGKKNTNSLVSDISLY